MRDPRNLHPHLRDNNGLIGLELKKAVQLSLAAKLEVGCHQLAGKATPVIGCAGESKEMVAMDVPGFRVK